MKCTDDGILIKFPIILHNTCGYLDTNILFNYTSSAEVTFVEKEILIDPASLFSVISNGEDNCVR